MITAQPPLNFIIADRLFAKKCLVGVVQTTGPRFHAFCSTRYLLRTFQSAVLIADVANLTRNLVGSPQSIFHLVPFDSVYLDRLRESFEMARTNFGDMQTGRDSILYGS